MNGNVTTINAVDGEIIATWALAYEFDYTEEEKSLIRRILMAFPQVKRAHPLLTGLTQDEPL